MEADEVGASLKFATAKVERAASRGNGERAQGPQRQAERGGDFNDPPPFDPIVEVGALRRVLLEGTFTPQCAHG